MRAAVIMRRLISLRAIRNRAPSLSITVGAIWSSSGGSAIWPNTRYINPRLMRSRVSSRSAISTRYALPTSPEDRERISA
jgi:hypothetical protein